MSASSDAEVIGRSLGEPEAFGLIYDRHAATLLRFLGRRAGAKVAHGPQQHAWGKSYEALDLEGPRWCFLERVSGETR
jgi:hypothetical protein